MATVVTRKMTAKTHPAPNRKRLRYEQPFSTHSRCIGRTEGSATGRGKSNSSGPASCEPADRGGNIFIRVSPGILKSVRDDVPGGFSRNLLNRSSRLA